MERHFPRGQGIWVWQLPRLIGDSAQAWVAEVVARGFEHVLIKAADGAGEYSRNREWLPEIARRLRLAHVQVALWGYHYGRDSEAEARVAATMCKKHGADCYALNAEIEFEQMAMAEAERRMENFIRVFRQETAGAVALGLSTFALPSLHGRFPYREALTDGEQCDFVMPQVYTVRSARWPELDNTLDYARKAIGELRQFGKPVIPTLRAYLGDGKTGAAAEREIAFDLLETAIWARRNDAILPAWNFWEYRDAQQSPLLWLALGAGHVLSLSRGEAGIVDGAGGAVDEARYGDVQAALRDLDAATRKLKELVG